MLAVRNASQNEEGIRAQSGGQSAAGAVGQPAPTGYDSVKVVADAVLALLLLVLAAPVILLAAVAVKLTSRGPAFYFQRRLGRHGRPYRIFKIRTMVQNCESRTGPCWATARDPRVTAVGWFLRRTHLDELPQLWNVLRGEMSLVGPRPERPEFLPVLEEKIPYYRQRLGVRPGMTGLAQVQLPPDSDLDSVRRKLMYDLYYVRERGLWLDLQVLLTTACYLLGVPFAVPRRLLRVPSGEVVERAYQDLLARAEVVPQLQPA